MKTEFTICFNCTNCMDLGNLKYVCTARPTGLPVHPVTGKPFMGAYVECFLINTLGTCSVYHPGANNVRGED